MHKTIIYEKLQITTYSIELSIILISPFILGDFTSTDADSIFCSLLLFDKSFSLFFSDTDCDLGLIVKGTDRDDTIIFGGI